MTVWALVYEDGSTFSSEDGAPQESPAWGVVAVAQRGMPDASDRHVLGGQYALVWRTDLEQWVGIEDPVGLAIQWAEHGHEIAACRFGVMMGHAAYMERRALADKLHEELRADCGC